MAHNQEQYQANPQMWWLPIQGQQEQQRAYSYPYYANWQNFGFGTAMSDSEYNLPGHTMTAPGSESILSDQSSYQQLYPTFHTMTTAALPQQALNLRNDSVIDQSSQSQTLPTFRVYSHAASVDAGRMSSNVVGFDSGHMSPAAAASATTQPLGAASGTPNIGPPAGKVAIPALDRRQSSAATPCGPIRKNWEVQPRPKPGRKPMENDPTEKRKTQNRVAQRNHRDKRAKAVQSLQAQMDEEREKHRQEILRLTQHMTVLTAEKALSDEETARQADVITRQAEDIAHKDAEIDRLKRMLDTLPGTPHTFTQNSNSNSVSSGQPINHHQHEKRPSQVISILTPQSDAADDMEIDFTHIYARKPEPLTSTASPIGEDDTCGFCTNPDNCLCRQSHEETMHDHDLDKDLPPMDPARATNLSSLSTNASTPTFLEAPTKASGPGTCDMCLADPQRARECRELAQTAQFTSSSVPSSSTIATVPLPGRNVSKNDDRMSCSDFFTSARQKNVQLGPDAYRQISHIYPYHRGDGRLEHLPAMELDAHDAAHALAALSRQDTRSSASTSH